MEDGIAEGLQNWFKILNHLYVDLIEPRRKNDAQVPMTDEEFNQAESALREQRLNTIYNVSFYIDSFFSVASAIIELQKFTRYLRVRKGAGGQFDRTVSSFSVSAESADACQTAIEGVFAISLWSLSDDWTSGSVPLLGAVDYLAETSESQCRWLRSGISRARHCLSMMLVLFRPKASSNRLIPRYQMIIRARSTL